MMKEQVFGLDKKAVAHFIKIDPEAPFKGNFKIIVQNNWNPPTNATESSSVPDAGSNIDDMINPHLDSDVRSDEN